MANYPNGLVKTTTPSGSFGGVSVDNVRRTFGIGDKVAELAPAESIFFSYLSKIGKKPIDETVWKPLEYRNQWQRRNFDAAYQADDGDTSGAGVKVTVKYDKKGVVSKSNTYAPIFLVPGQILRIKGVAWKIAEDAVLEHMTAVAAGGDTVATGAKGAVKDTYILIPHAKLTKVSDNTVTFATSGGGDDGEGQVLSLIHI